MVRDQLGVGDYVREEDPRLYVSERTGRGPLQDDWIQEYWAECQVGGRRRQCASVARVNSNFRRSEARFTRIWNRVEGLDSGIVSTLRYLSHPEIMSHTP